MNRFFTLFFAASCLTAVGQSELCLNGTVWDEILGGCVNMNLNSADINNDGCVQLNDLLDLLSAYGSCDGSGLSNPDQGCTDPTACNWDPWATVSGTCVFPSVGCDCPAITTGSACLSGANFTCGQPFVYRGYAYKTVEIGDACWFAENFRATNYLNGEAIPTGLTNTS